ncbi:MAG: polysaccharide deacetylase family protein [Sulfobacillus sp.]
MVNAHILSVDVERWSDATLLAGQVQRDVGQPLVRAQTERVLRILDQASVRATFFVVGEVARDNPGLVQEIAGHGHEIGCHGWTHDLLADLGRERLEHDLIRARGLLQELSGQPVAAFRAPTWSVDRRVPWAAEVIRQTGFTVDMSIFDGRHGPYGEPVSTGRPFRLATSGGDLWEFPTSVRSWSGLRVGGGFYWRVLPRRWVAASYAAKAHPAVGYLHPWEVGRTDWQFPDAVPAGVRFTMTAGVDAFVEKLGWLLSVIPWQPARDVVNGQAVEQWPRMSLSASGLKVLEEGE